MDLLEACLSPRRFAACRSILFMVRQVPCGSAEKSSSVYSSSKKICALLRHGEGGTGHQKPIYYFITYLFTLGLPWTLLLPFIFLITSGGRTSKTIATFFGALGRCHIYLFSLSAGKRPPYILPLYPPLALLMAVGIRRWQLAAHAPPAGLWFAGWFAP